MFQFKCLVVEIGTFEVFRSSQKKTQTSPTHHADPTHPSPHLRPGLGRVTSNSSIRGSSGRIARVPPPGEQGGRDGPTGLVTRKPTNLPASLSRRPPPHSHHIIPSSKEGQWGSEISAHGVEKRLSTLGWRLGWTAPTAGVGRGPHSVTSSSRGVHSQIV